MVKASQRTRHEHGKHVVQSTQEALTNAIFLRFLDELYLPAFWDFLFFAEFYLFRPARASARSTSRRPPSRGASWRTLPTGSCTRAEQPTLAVKLTSTCRACSP